jgi:hypothetical protein
LAHLHACILFRCKVNESVSFLVARLEYWCKLRYFEFLEKFSIPVVMPVQRATFCPSHDGIVHVTSISPFPISEFHET